MVGFKFRVKAMDVKKQKLQDLVAKKQTCKWEAVSLRLVGYGGDGQIRRQR